MCSLWRSTLPSITLLLKQSKRGPYHVCTNDTNKPGWLESSYFCSRSTLRASCFPLLYSLMLSIAEQKMYLKWETWSVVPSNRKTVSKTKIQESIIKHEGKKTFLTLRDIEHWNRLPRELCSFHPWNYSKPIWTHFWATCFIWPCFQQEGQTRQGEVPFSPSCCVVLWLWAW